MLQRRHKRKLYGPRRQRRRTRVSAPLAQALGAALLVWRWASRLGFRPTGEFKGWDVTEETRTVDHSAMEPERLKRRTSLRTHFLNTQLQDKLFLSPLKLEPLLLELLYVVGGHRLTRKYFLWQLLKIKMGDSCKHLFAVQWRDLVQCKTLCTLYLDYTRTNTPSSHEFYENIIMNSTTGVLLGGGRRNLIHDNYATMGVLQCTF